jgi:hypothetical protein
LIYDDAPSVESPKSSPLTTRLRVPWSSDDELAAALRNGASGANLFTRLRSLLTQVGPSVEKNAVDFRAFALCAECLEKMVWRVTTILEKPMQIEKATSLIRNIAARDRELTESLNRDWDSGRPADSEAKLGPLFGMQPKDQLLYSWQRAASYSAELAQQPERFHRLLTS